MNNETLFFPSVLIAGAPKAGTSSLHTWLADHPDVTGSIEKETYFLCDAGTHMFRPESNIANGPHGYRAVFPEGALTSVTLESTPSYLYSQSAVETIAALATPPKVIFVLREPAAQIFSLYRYFKENWNWIPAHMSFENFLTACRSGTHDFSGNELAQNALINAQYATHLDKWRKALPADHLKVALFDDLKADERQFTWQIAQWLGLDPAFYDNYAFPRDNETYAAKWSALQRLNIAIRGALPRGRAYSMLRAAYRRMNTTAPSPMNTTETVILQALRSEFREQNALLANDYDLDLSSWNRDETKSVK